jgi:MobA/VirD2-like, nuclease domain
MILKGNQRANGQELARHLLNADDNEHALVHEMRGFLADDLFGAFQEAEAISLGTKCQQYLFSMSLSPPQLENVSVKAFEAAIANIERRLGLTDQPRAIVFHEKKGRRHAHCVWSRIDTAKMRAINLSHYKLRLTDISRELYLEHGWDMPAGLRNRDNRDPLNYSDVEASQAKRSKHDPAELKDIFKACWSASDSKASFAAALREHGFCLARGNRRGFVAVDANGDVYSISRWCGGKAKEVRSRLGTGAGLPTVEDAVAMLVSGNTETRAHTAHETDQSNVERIAHHAERLSDLVARQRKERLELTKNHEERRLAEIAARQSRLPIGLRAAWARLTGQYQRICQELATKAVDFHAEVSRVFHREVSHL